MNLTKKGRGRSRGVKGDQKGEEEGREERGPGKGVKGKVNVARKTWRERRMMEEMGDREETRADLGKTKRRRRRKEMEERQPDWRRKKVMVKRLKEDV